MIGRLNRLVSSIALLILVLIFPALASPVNVAGNAEVIKIGFPQQYIEPYSVVDKNGKVTGLLPELFKLYASHANYQVEMQTYPTFNDVMVAFTKGELDVMVGVSATLGRDSIMKFSEPILAVRRVTVSTEAIQSYKELESKTLTAITGFADKSFLTNVLPKAQILSVPSNYEAIKAIASGLADAQIGDGIMLYEHYKNSPYKDDVDLYVLDDLPVDTLYIGVAHSEPELLQRLNRAIVSIGNNIERNAILTEFLDQQQRQYVRDRASITLSSEEQIWINKNQTIEVGIAVDWKPIDFALKGQHKGISADVLREVSKLTGLTFKPVYHDTHKQNYTAFINNEFEFMSSMSPSPERRELMAFTQPFMREPWVLIGRSQDYEFDFSFNSLKRNDVIGIVASTYGQTMAKELCSNCQVRTFSGIKELVYAIDNEEVNVGASSLVLASPYLQGQYAGQLKVINQITERSFIPVAFAVNKDNQILLNIINKALGVIPPSRLLEIEKFWLNTSYNTGIQTSKFILWLAIIIATAAVIIGFIVFSNRRLTREVAHRIEVENELRDAEVRARKAEQSVQYLADNVNGAVIQHKQSKVNPNDISFTFVSAGIQALLGVSAEALKQDYRLFVQAIRKQDQEQFILNSRTGAKEGLLSDEICVEFADQQKWLHIQSRVISEEQHFIWNTVLTDITALKQQQAELEQAREQAVAVTEAKSRFLANMSHEIRTPISGIISLLEISGRYPMLEEVAKIQMSLTKSADNLLHIVNDILDFSKIEAGKLSLSPVAVDIRAMLSRITQVQASHAHAKQLRFEYWLDPNIAETVSVDDVRLGQVLNNFINNAIKFTHAGQIRLAVDVLSDSPTEQQICFSIADSGVGIDKASQSKLFQAFVQADESTNRKFGGTGLGLTISHQLVQQMQGEITVNSELGKGSCFRVMVTLPVLAPTQKQTLADKRCLLLGDLLQRDDVLAYLQDWQIDSETCAISEISNKTSLAYRMAKSQCNVLLLKRRVYVELGLSTEWLQQQLPGVSCVLFEATGMLSPEPFDSHWMMSINPLMSEQLYHALSGAPVPDQQSTVTQQQTQVYKQTREQAIADKRLILVAEDHPINRQVITTQLAQLGYQADVVNDGLEALVAMDKQHYDLLLTDCHMPEMDGYELTQSIRTQEAQFNRQAMPIIALTANAIQGEDDKCLELSMNAFLSKPVSMTKLAEVLENWLPEATDGMVVDATSSIDVALGAQTEAAPVIAASTADDNVDPLAALDEFDFSFGDDDEFASGFEDEFESPLDAGVNVALDVATNEFGDNKTSQPLLDLAVISDIFGDDMVAKQVMADFVRSQNEDMALLETALQQQAHAKISDISHRMKGAARMLSCDPLSDVLEQLEAQAKQANSAAYPPLVSELTTLMQRLNEDV